MKVKRMDISVYCIWLAIACTSVIVAAKSLILQYLFSFLAISFMIAGIWIFIGGFPPCKERLKRAFGICKRCIGFYFGYGLAVLLHFIIKSKVSLDKLPKELGAVFICVSFIFAIPTIYQGSKRRYFHKILTPQNGFYFWLAS